MVRQLAVLSSALVLTAAPWCSATSQAQNQSSTGAAVESRELPAPEVAEIYLKNGLKVLLKEDHSSPVVSVGCWYRVGSQDAELRTTGISHFLEHLTFRGEKVPSATAERWIAQHAGGVLHGCTLLDQTAYFASVVSSGLEDLLRFEARRMERDRFDTQDVQMERGVVISELLGHRDDPRSALEGEVVAAALKRHPYRWPTWGWLQDVQRMSSDELWDHYRRYYSPQNAILVLVGDFQVDKTKDLIQRLFGKIPRRRVSPRVPISEPEQKGERRVRLTGLGRIPYLQMAYHAPGIHQADLYGLWVLDALLCRAKGLSLGSETGTDRAARTSRLYQALIDSELATHVRTSLNATQSPYLYKLSVTLPDSSHFELAEEMVDYELERLRQGQFSDQDLDRARRQLKTRFLLNQNTIGKLAHQLGYFESIASSRILQSFTERIEAVSRVDLQRVARRVFAKESRTVGWFVPKVSQKIIEVEKLSAGSTNPFGGGQALLGGPEPFPLATPVIGPPGYGSAHPNFQVAGRLSVRVAAEDQAREPSEEPASLPASLINHALPASWTSKRQVLANGIVVWIVSRPTHSTFSLRLAFRAGAARDSDGEAGLAHLSGRLLIDGPDDSPSPVDAIESLGLSLATKTNYLATTVHLEGLGADLSRALASAAPMVRNADFSERDFSREKGVILNELRQEADSGAHAAEQAFRRRVFPQGHPWRRNVKGNLKTVPTFQRADAMRFHQQFFRPDQLVIAVASDRGIDEVVSSIQQFFGDWQTQEAVEPMGVDTVAPGLGVGRQFIRMSGRSYGNVVYGLPGVSRRHPDYFPLMVLTQILGQEGRLGKGSVDRKGRASGPFSSLGASLDGGALMIRVGAIPRQVDEVVALLEREVARLRDQEVTQGEVVAAKNFLINSMLVNLSSNSGVTAALAEAEWFHPGENALRSWLDRVSQVTVDQVIDVSRTRLLLDRAAIVVAGP